MHWLGVGEDKSYHPKLACSKAHRTPPQPREKEGGDGVKWREKAVILWAGEEGSGQYPLGSFARLPIWRGGGNK